MGLKPEVSQATTAMFVLLSSTLLLRIAEGEDLVEVDGSRSIVPHGKRLKSATLRT